MFDLGYTGYYNLTYNDTDFGPTQRWFYINIPANYDPNQNYSSMIFFHGTGGSGSQPWLVNLGTRRNVITVFPQGMGDTYDGSQAWNVPNKPNDTSFCTPDTEITACYDSCRKLNLCTVCSWTTCYNDVEFVDALMEHLNQNLCLNSSDVHISGSSNGAMFVYYLTS